jgi:hypothetical protein
MGVNRDGRCVQLQETLDEYDEVDACASSSDSHQRIP